MSKVNNKQMVEKIKKMALDFFPGTEPPKAAPVAPVPSAPPPNLPPPPPPPVGTPAPAPEEEAAVVPPSGQAPVASATGPVVNMQTALKNLARTMTSEVDVGAGPAKPGEPAAPQDQEGQQKALSRLSFADFITQHYTRNSDIPGVEFDWDPSKTKMEDKDPTKPTRTNVVMDTMQRIGSHGDEFKVDGVWGPRTNASLRNAYALAFGLLEMARSFHYTPRTYDSSKLAQLKDNIPHAANELSGAEKVANAKEITPHLQAISRLYHEVKEHVFDKPANKSYIEGTEAYTTYKAGGPTNPKLFQDLSQKFANLKVNNVPITVNDLFNKDTLLAWQKKNAPDMSPLDILAQIKGAI